MKSVKIRVSSGREISSVLCVGVGGKFALRGVFWSVFGKSGLSDGEIVFIDFEAGEGGDVEVFGGEGGGADAEEGIEEIGVRAFAVDADTLFDQGGGEGGGVGALFVAGLDGFVGNEPGVAATTQVGTFGVFPALDVALIDVGDAGGAAVEGDGAGFGEVEDVLVAVVDVALRVDGFEVSGADLFACAGFDGDGFDPVEGVLQDEEVRGAEGEEELVREEGAAGGATDVEEEGSVVSEDATNFCGPVGAPGEVVGIAALVVVFPVVDAEIVGRGGDDEVLRGLGHLPHSGEAVLVVKMEVGRQVEAA